MSDKSKQGKLKQRLEELKEETETDSILSGMLTLSRCDIDALLDEAKADFFKDLPNSFANPSRFLDPDWVDHPADYAEYSKDLLLWFSKWFGGGAP